MKDFSYITNSSPSFVESLYQDYVNNPGSVDPDFRKFFEGFDFAVSSATTDKKPQAATNGQNGSNGAVSVAAPKEAAAP